MEEEDEEEGYPEKGIKGGTKAAKAEAKKGKKIKEGEADAAVATEEDPKEEAPEEESPEEEEKSQRREIDPDEYMKALKELEDTLSNLDISGNDEEEEEE